MNRVLKRIITSVTVILTLMMCVSMLYACDTTPQDAPPAVPSPSYTLAQVQVYGGNVMMLGEVQTLSVSASARKNSGQFAYTDQGFTFESSDKSVASVSPRGEVRALASGYAEITVMHKEYGAQSKFGINVITPSAASLSASLKTLGRVRNRNGNPVLVNFASGFETAFNGTQLTAEICTEYKGDDSKTYLRVVCDGNISTVVVDGTDNEVTLASGLSEGLHFVRVYKMTDESHSSIEIKSLSVSDGNFYNLPKNSNLRISVYGDGTTSGIGLNDGFDGSNAFAPSYAVTLADNLNADLDAMCMPDVSLAVKGRSATNYVKDVWNRYALTDGELYDVAGNPSDVIIINLGDSDAYGINRNAQGDADYAQSDVQSFVQGYVDTVAAMRQANPGAKIICAYGMTSYSQAVGNSVRRAVKLINADGDKNVYAVKLSRFDDKNGGEYPDEACHNTNAAILCDVINGFFADVPVAPQDDYDTDKQDLHVVLLGGQSNMEGNSHWRYLESDVNFSEYKQGYQGIKMSFANNESLADKAPDFQAVRIGYGGAYNNTDKYVTEAGTIDDTFGPDLGFAKALSDNGYGEKVAFIKFAIGATSFSLADRNWRAPAGTLYKAFVIYVDNCLKELSKTYNVTLDAMFWMQGESDTESQQAVDAYKCNLGNFVHTLRRRFAKYNSDFAFYDSLIVWPSEWQGDRPEQINAIKRSLAQEIPYYTVIDNVSSGLTCQNEPVGKVDLSHYDALSEIKLGNMYAQAYMRDFPLI